MKISIRTRLFVSLSLMIALFAFMSWNLTYFGLEKYYIWQKKTSLINYARQINEFYRGNPEDISLELERIGNSLGAGIMIIDGNGQLQYSSFGRIVRQKVYDRRPDVPHSEAKPDEGHHHLSLPQPPLPVPPSVINKSREVLDERTLIATEQDEQLKIDFIVMEYTLERGEKLVIRQPLAAISESAWYAGRFVFFTGLVTVLLGFIWAYLYTGRFTQPLIKLNQIAQHMSRLDFSSRADIGRSDEIGQLSDSINTMSAKLDAAITELNEKNQQLQADVDKERRLEKMRRDFVSNVSHELKTPLALILGYTEGLKENVAQSEADKEFYCEVIADEAQKMDRLVRDLLDLSQIESGYFNLEKEEFDLSALLEHTALKYRQLLEQKNITLHLLQENELCAYADVMRIEQVLVNMLNNAIEHTEGEKVIEISVVEYGDKYRVSLYNSGNPMPQEVMQHVWTSFYKADKARTRALGGHGLGLSIVRAIQELHGNAYGVENMPGGVTFWFEVDKIQASV